MNAKTKILLEAILGTPEIPWEKMDSIALNNMKMALLIGEQMPQLLDEFTREYFKSLRLELKKALPAYKAEAIQFVPYGNPIILYKESWERTDEFFQKFTGKKPSKRNEKSIPLTYSLEFGHQYSFFYGIRKMSDRAQFDGLGTLLDEIKKAYPKAKNAQSTAWWPLLLPFPEELQIQLMNRRYFTQESLLKIFEQGAKELLQKQVETVKEFVEKTEPLLDKYIAELQ